VSSLATPALTLALRTEADVMLARCMAGDLAALLQLAPEKQISVSQAVGQVAVLAEGRGRVEFAVVDGPQSAEAVITVYGVSRSALRVAGDAPRVDLNALRQLVERVGVRDRDGVVVVELRASAGPDAWIPRVDELQIVLESLVRFHTDRRGRLDLPPSWPAP
jgi:hypothetical protein